MIGERPRRRVGTGLPKNPASRRGVLSREDRARTLRNPPAPATCVRCGVSPEKASTVLATFSSPPGANVNKKIIKILIFFSAVGASNIHLLVASTVRFKVAAPPRLESSDGRLFRGGFSDPSECPHGKRLPSSECRPPDAPAHGQAMPGNPTLLIKASRWIAERGLAVRPSVWSVICSIPAAAGLSSGTARECPRSRRRCSLIRRKPQPGGGHVQRRTGLRCFPPQRFPSCTEKRPENRFFCLKPGLAGLITEAESRAEQATGFPRGLCLTRINRSILTHGTGRGWQVRPPKAQALLLVAECARECACRNGGWRALNVRNVDGWSAAGGEARGSDSLRTRCSARLRGFSLIGLQSTYTHEPSRFGICFLPYPFQGGPPNGSQRRPQAPARPERVHAN